MAITVKDIQEKDFEILAANGYDPDQVDDFLDEIAVELGAVQAENQALKAQLAALQQEFSAVKTQASEMEKKMPDYNENGYFKNLESAMRESLIGAQRIADQTISDAQKKAQQTIDDANVQAEKTVSDADAQAVSIREAAEKVVAGLNAEAEQVKSITANYRDSFKKLIEESLAALDKNA